MIQKAAGGGSIKELDGLCNIAQHWSPEQLVILLPVFYHHLDPARIPDVVASKDVRAIMLARYSLKGVLVTLDCVNSPRDLTHAQQTISDHLISKWPRCHPWISFFYRHFFASSSPARLPGLLVTRSEALKLVVSMLMRMSLLGDSRTPNSLINTPSIHPIISELWCMAITSKDGEFIAEADKIMGNREQGAFQEHMSYVVQTCLDVTRPLFTNTLIDVAGGIRATASIAFRYIRNARSLCRKFLSKTYDTTRCDTVAGVPRCQMMLINCFGNCAVLLIVTSQQNCALREAYIERNLVALVLYTLRDLCQLSLNLQDIDAIRHVKKAFEEALGYIALLVVKGPVDDVVAVLCQALRAHFLPTVIKAQAYIPETDMQERINPLLISVCRSYLAFDKVLRISGSELEAEGDSLDAVAQCNPDLLQSWDLFKAKVHRYLDLRSQLPAASIFFDRQCAAVHVSDLSYSSVWGVLLINHLFCRIMMNGIRNGIFSSVPGAQLQDIVLDNARVRIGISVIASRASTSKLPSARLPMQCHLPHTKVHLQVRTQRGTLGEVCFSWPRSKKVKFMPTKSSYLNCG